MTTDASIASPTRSERPAEPIAYMRRGRASSSPPLTGDTIEASASPRAAAWRKVVYFAPDTKSDTSVPSGGIARERAARRGLSAMQLLLRTRHSDSAAQAARRVANEHIDGYLDDFDRVAPPGHAVQMLRAAVNAKWYGGRTSENLDSSFPKYSETSPETSESESVSSDP